MGNGYAAAGRVGLLNINPPGEDNSYTVSSVAFGEDQHVLLVRSNGVPHVMQQGFNLFYRLAPEQQTGLQHGRVRLHCFPPNLNLTGNIRYR
ncbi:hypothetical protein D3C81_2031090 [compost metagenome]